MKLNKYQCMMDSVYIMYPLSKIINIIQCFMSEFKVHLRFHFFCLPALAKREGSSSDGALPFVEKSLSALSLTVPPHLKPMDCSTCFSRSPPTTSSSAAEPNSSRLTGPCDGLNRRMLHSVWVWVHECTCIT